MTWSVLLFSVATFMCGAADSLETLVLWRILQGALGAPVIPLSQTILLDAFPARQHGMVTSIFGMAVVIGPVIGPTLGGYLSELYSWRWAFYMLVPVGLIVLHRPAPDPAARPADAAACALDWIGFLSCRRRSPACSWCCRAASGSTGSNRRDHRSRRSSPPSPSRSSSPTA